MLELMQDLYSSGVEMTIKPAGTEMRIVFYHKETDTAVRHEISSYILGGGVAMSMEMYVRLLLDNFIKEINAVRREIR
jgi:hypothetical protein